MFLEHRMRAFQGTFHARPDYALWYGWSELRRDLAEVKTMAEEMRKSHTKKKQEEEGRAPVRGPGERRPRL